jgi:hypothetical protein
MYTHLQKKDQKFNGKYTMHLSDLDENVYNVFNCDSKENITFTCKKSLKKPNR